MTFSKMASFNGLHMFLKTFNVELINTALTDMSITWKEFERCITLIVVSSSTSYHNSDILLNTIFNLMISMIGLKNIERPRSIEKLKKDLRTCYPIIDRLLECLAFGNKTGIKSYLTSHIIDQTDCIILSENHVFQVSLEVFF